MKVNSVFLVLYFGLCEAGESRVNYRDLANWNGRLHDIKEQPFRPPLQKESRCKY